MALPTTMTTEVEAVNVMLRVIGQQPISSLPPAATDLDAVLAYETLGEELRTVLHRGWNFNTETVTLTASGGYLTLPSGALWCRVFEQAAGRDLVSRGSKLYDRETNSFDITNGETAVVEVVTLLPWDALPEHARNYIKIKAARVFQNRSVGSGDLYQFSKEDENMALSACQQADAEIEGRNMLMAPTLIGNILNRRI